MGRHKNKKKVLTLLLLSHFMASAQAGVGSIIQPFDGRLREFNEFAQGTLSSSTQASADGNGNIYWGGEKITENSPVTGNPQESNYEDISATFGSDKDTISKGEDTLKEMVRKRDNGEEKDVQQHAYELLEGSYSTEKPDLRNDSVFKFTDSIFSDLKENADEPFDVCEITTRLVSGERTYRLPDYKSCTRVPAIQANFTIKHDYDIGVLRFSDGLNQLSSCGENCIKIGVGYNTFRYYYAGGRCRIYTVPSTFDVLEPRGIKTAKLTRARIDDHIRVSVNDIEVYRYPSGPFPLPTTTWCENGRDFRLSLDVDVTRTFSGFEAGDTAELKIETAVTDLGNGYAEFQIELDPAYKIHSEVWTDDELIEKALRIKRQTDDGFCTSSVSCTEMPSLDSNGCLMQNGVKVCEDDFEQNPLAGLGINPFCRSVSVTSTCGLNREQAKIVEQDNCEKYEDDPQCSFIKNECVGGAQGVSGFCYHQMLTFDCGTDEALGDATEQEVITCNGEIACVGEDCYSPKEDADHNKYQEAVVFTEVVKMAQSDISCVEMPDGYAAEAGDTPNTYYQVPLCSGGYQWSETNGACIKEVGCSYNSSNFFLTSQSSTSQVVEGGSLIKEFNGGCQEVRVGSNVYKCGSEQEVDGGEVFHELCVYQVSSEPTPPLGCPSESHVYNAEKGWCEVAANDVCSEPLDSNGNCAGSSEKECPAEYPNFNETEGRCEKDTNGLVESSPAVDPSSCQIFSSEPASCRSLVGNIHGCCDDVDDSIGNMDGLLKDTLDIMAAEASEDALDDIPSEPGTWTELDGPDASNWETVSGNLSSTADSSLDKLGDAESRNAVPDLQEQIKQRLKEKMEENGASSGGSEEEKESKINRILKALKESNPYYVALKQVLQLVYQCKDEEIDLTMKRKMYAAHKVGRYCAEDVLGVCLEKVDAYCVFSSPLSRIMMQQIYQQSQMNLSWGTPEQPNCRGLAIEDLEKVDFSSINLDEWVAILIRTNNLKGLQELNIENLTGDGSSADLAGQDRENVLEKTEGMLNDVDLEGIRRDAYEERRGLSEGNSL